MSNATGSLKKAKPTTKVLWGGSAGLVAVMIISLLTEYNLIEVKPSLASMITWLSFVGVAWLKKRKIELPGMEDDSDAEESADGNGTRGS